MIPLRLQVSGFLSYLDPVNLDFTSFEVACISGANGAGKSSLLDAITWAMFGEARRRDDAIINSHATTAEVVLDLEYEGDVFRIQRIKPRGKTAVLEFSERAPDGSWKILTERSIRETEARIRQTLHLDYNTFINASFFLQGQADLFAQQKPGDRKKILSNILGLEVWETYKNAASERRKRLDSEQTGLDGQLSEIMSELAQEDSRRARLEQLEQQLTQYQAMRQSKEAEMDALRRLAASLAEQRKRIEQQGAQVMAARQRQEQLIQQVNELHVERAENQARVERAEQIKAAYQAWQEARASLERWDEVARSFHQVEQQRSAPLMQIETEKARLEQQHKTLLAEERAVRESAGRLATIEAELIVERQIVSELVTQLNQRPELEAELRTLQGAQSDAASENRQLKQEMDELKERILRLSEAEGAVCPLCGQPLSGPDRANLVTELQTQGRDKADRYRQNIELKNTTDRQRDDLDRHIRGLASLEAPLRNAQANTDRLTIRLTDVQTLMESWESGGALKLREITETLEQGSFASAARADLAKIDAALKELGYDAAAHDAIRREELAGRASEEQLRQLEAARAALAPLEREIARLEAQAETGGAELNALDDDYERAAQEYNAAAASLPDLNRVEDELFKLQQQENIARRDVGGAQQAVFVLDGLRKRQASLGERRTEITRLVGQLKQLERAFGKDGVPALLIEQALPEIEELANEILDRLSGGNMSVRFATQKDYKDKKREDKLETLDILISDGAGQRDYEMFSGGEAFRVNFAIRLALSRFLAQRAGARLQTLVIDEGFGSQDTEGRQRLIEAINMVRPNFAKILAITHMDELKDAFPVRVEVIKTARGSQVSVIG